MTLLVALLRGVLVTALLLLIGTPPAFALVVFPELDRRGLDATRASRFARRTVAWTVAAALCSAIGLAVLRAGGVGALGGWAVGTVEGRAWLVLAGGGSCLAAATAVRSVRPANLSRGRWLGVVLAGGSVMLLAFCRTRYSTAVDSAALAIGVKFWHMAGAAAWVGGLAVLAALPRYLPDETGTEPARVAAALVRRFSMVAVAAVTVAFVTGVIIVTWHVPSLAALATTPYGLALALKVLLVFAAAGLGGFNRLVVHQRLRRAGGDAPAVPGLLVLGRSEGGPADAVASLVRAIRLELAVLLAVVALSVALTSALTPSHAVADLPSTSGVAVDARRAAGATVDAAFRSALEFGAIGVALLGSLTLGYELGEFSVRRR
ncbi:CopD family protein [Halomarina pelagica]|uniref:CopD family protein n=1 Tax=Halomarina pelagica TaxID=2961599 RepID=UPI0020C4EE79|nr:CopD family protein [Halomarina sp. BND7]